MFRQCALLQHARGPNLACCKLARTVVMHRRVHHAVAVPLGSTSKTVHLAAGQTRSLTCSRIICNASKDQETTIDKEQGGPSVDDKVSNLSGLRVVLVHPQIPGNTGTIARTCAATATPLHLVAPLGFDIDDKAVKRAGLDYWPYVFVKCHESWEEFYEFFKQQEGPRRLVGFSKKGANVHTEAGAYRPGDWLLFGAETSGLPDGAWEACRSEEHGGGLRRIPIEETHVRSLNLAVSAGIGVYEAKRQVDLFIVEEQQGVSHE